MNLVPINIDAILVGQPLPCALRAENGMLLASKGFLVDSKASLELMVGTRSQIYIDESQTDNFRRGYFNRLNNLVLEDRSLGQIAETQISPYDAKRTVTADVSDEPNWVELQTQAHVVLRDNNADTFLPRLDRLQSVLNSYIQSNPDGTLFALIHQAGSEIRQYAASHALLVAAMCSLAAQEVLKWPPLHLKALRVAALTMNIGMTELQDRLANQKEPPTSVQLQRINSHAAQSVDLLQQMGVTDALWLEAVLNHSAKVPGRLAERSDGQRLARLIQRADMFAAQLSPRANRAPQPPSAAMQSCYFDENRQIDEAGAALIKAVGIYSPGTYVRLSNQEIAVVIKRGHNTTMPRVAVLINRQGMPTGEPILRDTSLADFRILSSIAFRDVRATHSLDRLMALTRQASPERRW